MHRSIAILLASSFPLAGCSGAAAGNDGAPGTNVATNLNEGVPAPAHAVTVRQRPVRIGVDGEHGMDACHTEGRISGQDSVAILAAPDAAAPQVDHSEPGLTVDICETITGWYGIVYRGPEDPEQDCGTGENLDGPQAYGGACRSGWVPEINIELTAG